MELRGFTKENMLRATTATSIAKKLMGEEKLGLFSMPPRKARTSVGKLQARDLAQDRELKLSQQGVNCPGKPEMQEQAALLPLTASKPQVVVWSNRWLWLDSYTRRTKLMDN